MCEWMTDEGDTHWLCALSAITHVLGHDVWAAVCVCGAKAVPASWIAAPSHCSCCHQSSHLQQAAARQSAHAA